MNGTAGAVVAPPGRVFSVMAFTVTDGKIVQIDVLLDPERLSNSISACHRPPANTGDRKRAFRAREGGRLKRRDTRCGAESEASNPATLSGLRASRIVSGRLSGFVSNVAGSGDEDHLVSSQIAVRPPSTWMIAPLM